MKSRNIKNKKLKKRKAFFKKCNRVIIVIELIVIVFLIYCCYNPLNSITTPLIMNNFESYAKQYQNDPFILDVTYKCENATDIIECVWAEVPYEYDNKRAESNIKNFLVSAGILSPERYFGSGGKGICRDNAVMLKAVLNNLNINSTFTITLKRKPMTLVVG